MSNSEVMAGSFNANQSKSAPSALINLLGRALKSM
jgi:hypothetical protein